MKGRNPIPLPEHDYPVDPWRLVERRFSKKFLNRTETLFAVANGYVGVRGNHEEGRPAHDHGTFVNGFHETWPIVHAEEAYGLARTGQTIIDVPDAKIIKLYVDDEPLYLPTAYLTEYERVLDMRRGTLERSLVWETASGKQVQVRTKRLASIRHRHLVAMSYEFTILNSDAPVVISSQLLNRQDTRAPDELLQQFDPRSTRTFAERVLYGQLRRVDDKRIIVGYRVARSGMTLAAGMEHVVESENQYRTTREASDDLSKVTFVVAAKAGVPFRLTKYAAYHTASGVPASELADRADRVLNRSVNVGFERLAADQEEDCARFWERSDVRIENQPELQQAVRWNLFQLMQASIRAEGTGIPAKGLTGHGYEGQYFWDVEIYVMPFLTYTEPRIARNLLRFRRSMLDAACERAAELGHPGALFPWRTITGEEASAYYQAGTAQYHLNADIAHALKRYVDVAGDKALLSELGTEVLVETARLWVDLGFYDDDGAFHLHSVTGPDEYTTVVNDNTFTNLMARLNLRYAAEVLEWLRDEEPYRYRVLSDDVALTADEMQEWRRAADAMHLPYDERRGVHPQDEHFLEREAWDFENTPTDKYPLLLHFHPLVIYRHQVLKQADVVLAMFLLGNQFSEEQRRRNFEYYEPITTSDSSLSPAVHSIVAADIGDQAKAMEHFRLSLYVDLADVAGNVHHGVHVAASGGSWMALVFGFGGLRDYDGHFTFNPRLPAEWSRLEFPLQIRGQHLDVDVRHDSITLCLREGPDLEVTVEQKVLQLIAGEPIKVDLTPIDQR